MKHLVSKKLADMAAMEIAAYIVDNKIAPGEKLPSEKFFSEYFGISRPSIREGMSRLMSIGLLYSVQGFGVVLNDISVDAYFLTMENSLLNRFITLKQRDVASIIETRTLLEQHACKCFLTNGTDEELTRMREIVQELWTVIDKPELFRTKDVEFHLQVVGLSHNHVLKHLYTLMRAPAEREIEILMKLEDIKRVQMWHVRILEALENRDEQVCELVQAHLFATFPIWVTESSKE